MKFNALRLKGLALILGCFILISGSALAAYDEEDGVFYAEDGNYVEDKTGVVSGYVTLSRGARVYADANRKDPLGYPTEDCIVYAIRNRVYEKGCLYELRFDTSRTTGEKKYVTAYYYSRDLELVGDTTKKELSQTGLSGARIVDGVALTTIPFHYGVETEAESSYNIVTASGTVYIAKTGVNMRKGPGRDQGIIVQLPRGTKITVTGLVTVDKGVVWYWAHDDSGNEGFVMAEMTASNPVTLTNEATPTPEPAETPAPEETSADEAPASAEEVLTDTAADETAAPGEETGTEDEATNPDETPDPDATPNPEETPNPDDTAEPEETEESEETPERSVHVSVTWQTKGEKKAFGDTVILTAELTGYDDVTPVLQWQSSTDGSAWTDVAGETGTSMSVVMTKDNYKNFWRVLATAPDAEQNEDDDSAGNSEEAVD